jgi:hypothetical protein
MGTGGGSALVPGWGPAVSRVSMLENGRCEVTWVALAAAEICWAAPALMLLTRVVAPHSPLLLWLGMLVVLLGFFYLYRTLLAADLPMRFQQGLVAAALFVAIGLFLRYHVYAGVEGRGIGWFMALFRSMADAEEVQPGGGLAMMTLVYLWMRALHLARRSRSAESVGFSFRSGVVVLIAVALLVKLFARQDVSGFVMPYFFFSLVAVALARVEEIRRLPNSSQVGYSGFWIGWTVAAVAGLVLLATLVGAFFHGGGLAQVLEWLSPVVVALQIIVFGAGILFLIVVEGLLDFLSIDLEGLGQGLQDALRRLAEALMLPTPEPVPGVDQATRPPLLGVMQVVMTVGIPLAVVGLVLLLTWYRWRQVRREEADESRESLLTAAAVARNVRAMLQAGIDRLGNLAGLVNRFGLGSRFLAAISVRRIYANLHRLAKDAGYPRSPSQTPYEYLDTLYRALPGSEADVRVITEAYVNAHYGQVPDTREELQRIRECWERVRDRTAREQA